MNVFYVQLRLIYVWLLLCLCGTLAGQSFRHVYAPDDSYCLDFMETPDGGFLLVGGVRSDSSLFLQRTDAIGNPVWTANQSLNGARGIAVCSTSDGGFAVLCENYSDGGVLSNVLLRIDSTGATLWQKILSNPNMPNSFRDVVCTSDGGFALIGNTRTFVPVSDFHLELLRLDANGDTLWSQILGNPADGIELAIGLLEMPNGDLAVAGEQRDAPGIEDVSDFFLARTDAQGNVLWQQTYPKPGYQTALDFKADPSGNLLLLGQSKKLDPVKTALLKTGGDGAEIWFRQPLSLAGFLSDSSNLVNCFTLDPAGNIYIPYLQTGSSVIEQLKVLKLSSAGDSVWTHGSDLTDLPQAALLTSDSYFAFAGGTSLNTLPGKAVLIKGDWAANFSTYYNSLYGTAFWDKNGNCSKDTLEASPPHFIAQAENQSGELFYGNISPSGDYLFSVVPGTYTVTVRSIPGTETLWQTCDTPVVDVPTIGLSVPVPDIAVQQTADCPYLVVELAAAPFRRCTTTTYYVNYCNQGSQTATDVEVQLTLDALCSYANSSIPLAGQSGDILFFELPDLDPGDCGYFTVKVSVDCAAENGQAICAEAHIYPDSSCLPPDPFWDGSHVEVNANCSGSAEFTISNTGTGDMSGTVNYVIIEDQIMYMQGALQLDAGSDSTITIINPTGNSYYLQADQRPGHPGNSVPAAVADMCNGQNGFSLALQLPLNSADPFVDIYCAPVVGSYDPNDKTGFPGGWKDEHLLEVGREIEYLIRFQNTGNDTAFLVVIQDTLLTGLDPATVRPGPASHPYRFELNGPGILRFVFSNILLPDSTTNEPESQGFVSFRVAQQPDLSPGTVLENSAAIYFDFNEPVITNTYFHTIAHPLLTFTVDPPKEDGFLLRIFPNPVNETAEVRILGSNGSHRFSLFDFSGRLVREAGFTGGSYRFERGDLQPGMYFFRVENAEGKKVGGKLILN